MTATNHTEHYELSQYTEEDHPTYTGDYNSDMSKIDAAIYAASQSGGDYATTESATQAIAAAIADRLTAGDIKPGNGINIETSGNQVTISYAGGGSAGGLSLDNRIAALESQVAALTAAATPEITGPTSTKE